MARNRGRKGRRNTANDYEKSLRTYTIVACVMVAINAVVSFLLWYPGLIECAILLALVLLIHKTRSKIFAIVLLVYAIASSVYGLLYSGSLTGYLWIILGFGYLKVLKGLEGGKTRGSRAMIEEESDDDFDF